MSRRSPARILPAAAALALLAALALPGLAAQPAPAALADSLLGIPYRPDGVRDENGRWTLFEHPAQTFATPGLNCSGLTFALWRLVSGSNVTIADAARDRLGDSGPGAAMGRDWDFGFDLILNLSDGFTRRWLLPEATAQAPSDSGQIRRGFVLTDRESWRRALAALPPGHVGLVSFSQTGRRAGYTLQHYHVGIIVPDASGGRWLYQATPRSGVFKLNLAAAEGMARFQEAFGGRGEKRVLLLDVALPAR